MVDTSYIKSKIYGILALIVLSVSFTFPMIVFHGSLQKIDNDNYDKISSFTKKVWNFYNEGRYKSPSTSKEVYNDLDKMIENSAEIGVASFPLWAVSLEAANYPKDIFPQGIPVYFHFDGFSGEVHEMNTINHYIGMDPMWVGGKLEREISIYAFLIISLIMVFFIVYNNKISKLLMFIPVLLPVFFIIDYAYWLYWFGHNLHDWGAFSVKPFMPTLFGDGKLAQFTTHSYPAIGFYMLVVISISSLLSILSINKSKSTTIK